MALLTATFETGINGNTVSTGDAGSANAWDSVLIDTGGSLVYSNSHANNTLSAKVLMGASTAFNVTRWRASVGTITDHYGRMYVFITSNPGTEFPFMHNSQVDAVTCDLRLTTLGKIKYVDFASNTGTMATSVPLSQWFRVEWHVIHSVTVGQIEVKLFSNANSTTVTETLTSPATLNTLAYSDTFDFGQETSGGSGYTLWMDDIVAGALSYPGPAILRTDIMLPRAMIVR